MLANYANEYGISWPSQRTLADQIACSERTVRSPARQRWKRGASFGASAPARQRQPAVGHDPARGFRGAETGPAGPARGRGREPTIAGLRTIRPMRANRQHLPADNRHGGPTPRSAVAALDPSLILKDSAHNAPPNSHLACLAVAGPGLDQQRTRSARPLRPGDRPLASGRLRSDRRHPAGDRREDRRAARPADPELGVFHRRDPRRKNPARSAALPKRRKSQ